MIYWVISANSLPLPVSFFHVTLHVPLTRTGVHLPTPWLWAQPCDLYGQCDVNRNNGSKSMKYACTVRFHLLHLCIPWEELPLGSYRHFSWAPKWKHMGRPEPNLPWGARPSWTHSLKQSCPAESSLADLQTRVKINHCCFGTSLVVRWVRLCTPNAGGPGSIPGRGTRYHVPQLRSRHAATEEKDPACCSEDPVQPK